MAEKLIMPTLGLTMIEGTVDQWYKQVGDTVAKGEAVVTISSEKLTHDVESPIDGVLFSIIADEGAEVPCQELIGYVGETGEEIPSGEVSEKASDEDIVEVKETKVETIAVNQPPTRDAGARVFATPLAKKMAQAKGFNLEEIIGTGGNGRITRRDVERFVPSMPVASQVLSDIGEGLEGMRKVIAKRMHQSLHQSAQLTLHRKVDITSLLTFRQDLKAKSNGKLLRSALSINTLMIKAVTLALKEHPEMNAWYDGQALVTHDEIHMGVAVSVHDGLVVPVIRDVHQKGLSQIGEGFVTVTSQAVDGSLPGDLYSGSTFTITNLGNAGVEYFTPILNTPELGILGVGATTNKLIFDDNKEIKEISELPLSLTFDHQVIDGAPAAEFLSKITYYLENPYLLVV
ncbi:dihydrolipoamide acetyltransferase family protein [Vagococcus jeotgali]|uniref:dihydrolipoamide acetyltransferase family protein n=1 Tax=Vagococcus jeotgali TaxID=3109030 RepID=UPI002DDB0D19|nr:dihydrolipoamide acetyltransferase family protein [Vagococcus sp. B2T-5]